MVMVGASCSIGHSFVVRLLSVVSLYRVSTTYAQCMALPVAALETLRPAVLVGVVLVSTVVVDVLLVVHALSVLLGLALGLLTVEPILALGLRELSHVSRNWFK